MSKQPSGYWALISSSRSRQSGPDEPRQIEGGADGTRPDIKPGNGLAAAGGTRPRGKQPPAQCYAAEKHKTVRPRPHKARPAAPQSPAAVARTRSEEHTSE